MGNLCLLNQLNRRLFATAIARLFSKVFQDIYILPHRLLCPAVTQFSWFNMFARTVLSLLTAVAVVKTAAVFLPRFNARSSNCTTVEVRKEWRNLASAEQFAYLDAEICLMNLPAQTGLAAVTSRYSDLEALYQNLTAIIHDVGQFLPWHRYFVHVHHEILKTQCNYGGPVP